MIVLLMGMQPNNQKHKTYEVHFVHLEWGMKHSGCFCTTISDTARWYEQRQRDEEQSSEDVT